MGASIAAGAAAAAVAVKARPGRGMMLAAGVVGVAVIGLGALALTSGNKAPRAPNGPVPVIEARGGVVKERPTNPGGVEVPNQDKEILQLRPADSARPERLAPREEQPVDLTQAQRQAAAQPNGVRQIPGVAIVAPITVSPPPAGAPQAAAPEAQPRPVASVPITISGQPPAARPFRRRSHAAADNAGGAGACAFRCRSGCRASGGDASRATCCGGAFAREPACRSEPDAACGRRSPPPRSRRPSLAGCAQCRSGPRTASRAPQRAQPQPRVVPAAPATAATDPNGPLSLSPQANRGPAPAPVRQAAAPTQGMVPSSVPSLADPVTDAPETPRRTASTTASSGGFAVQLAAEGSEDAARAKFNRMRSQYGSVLGSASPSIRSAEVNGRSVYRVRVGDMSREEAVSLCERLKASGGTCFVARN